jgi:hypothetical protein
MLQVPQRRLAQQRLLQRRLQQGVVAGVDADGVMV